MLRIPCPHCGVRDYTEFRYGGDATKARPAHGSGDVAAWVDYCFIFDNPRGDHREYWQHLQGCRQWFVLDRNTATNKVGAAAFVSDAGRP